MASRPIRGEMARTDGFLTFIHKGYVWMRLTEAAAYTEHFFARKPEVRYSLFSKRNLHGYMVVFLRRIDTADTCAISANGQVIVVGPQEHGAVRWSELRGVLRDIELGEYDTEGDSGAI